MSEALRVFTRESAGADVSLVFYAGHGLEMDGVNYLGAGRRAAGARHGRAVRGDRTGRRAGGDGGRVATGGGLGRMPEQPSRAVHAADEHARRSVSRGSFGELDENLLGDETLVAYAAAAGTTAADGTGRNSPYTSALLAHLELPLELSAVFRQVRARVLEATDGGAAAARVCVVAGRALPERGARCGAGRGRGDGRRRCDGGGTAAAGELVLGVDPGEPERVGLRGVSAAVSRGRLPWVGDQPAGSSTSGRGGRPAAGGRRRR